MLIRFRLAAHLFVIALLATGTPLQAAPGDTRSFVILHSNDQHGHLLPFSYPDRVSKDDDVARMPARKNIGGIARRATLVRQIRAREKNVFLFDAGDCMDGTPFSTEFLGKADYDAMNGVGYDYAVPGNHDFNMTAAQFGEPGAPDPVPVPARQRLPQRRGQDAPAALPDYNLGRAQGRRLRPYHLLQPDLQGRRGGVPRARPPRRRPRAGAAAAQQADLVVLVAHDGLDVDRRMAREVPGIDIIVGGHSHTRVPHGIYALADNPGPGDPKGTIIVQAHQWVGEPGPAGRDRDRGADNRWRVSKYAASLLPVTDRYADDPAVARTVAGYWDKIKDKYAARVGQATDDFSEVDGLDPTNYYLVADAVKEASGAEFDLENFGGVRAPILKGPITMADLVTLDPFQNTVYTFKIKGADLKKLLVATRPATSAGLRYEPAPRGAARPRHLRRGRRGRAARPVASRQRHPRRPADPGRQAVRGRGQLLLLHPLGEDLRRGRRGHQARPPRRRAGLHP